VKGDNAVLKVTYSEIVKNPNPYVKGTLVERTKNVSSLKEAVNFSRYIANTANIVGKPVIEEID